MTKTIVTVATLLLPVFVTQGEEQATAPPNGVELRVSAYKDMSGTPGDVIPYQPARLQVAFDKKTWVSERILFNKIKLHSVTINGKPVATGDLSGMRVDGYGDAASEGAQWYHNFGYTGIIPRLPGNYRMEVVLETPKGLWQMSPLDVRIVIPEGEEEAYSAMLSGNVPRFLEHPWGMRHVSALLPAEAWWGVRPSDIPSQEQLPYAEVLKFIGDYPESIFTRLVYDRCVDTYIRDKRGEVNRMGVLPPFAHADRVEIARLLMIIDAEETTKMIERQLAVCQRGLARSTDENRQQAEGMLYWYQCWARLLEDARMPAE